MNREELFQIANRWIEELWQKKNFEAIDTLHSPEFTDHSPAGRKNDNEGYMQGMMDLQNAFPDFMTTVEDYIIDPERNEVAIRWTAAGTFKSAFLGFKPSGNSVNFRGIDIIRIKDGKITDRWGEWDGFDIMEQLLHSSVGKVIQKMKK